MLKTINMNKTNSQIISFLSGRLRLFVLFLTVITPLIMTSCWKDRFDMENISTPDTWSPDVCAPLVHSKMTMRDILNDYDHNNLFVEDGTHFLYLVYWNTVFSQSAGQMFAIPDQNVNTSFPFSVVGALPFGTDLVAPPYTKTYSFTMPGGEILTSATLNDPNGGNFSFNINSADLNQNATINISIPAATKGGVPFNQDINFFAGVPTIVSFDLSGYTILFNNITPNVNAVDITYTVTVHGTGNPNNSPYNFNMNESFQIMSFHSLFGDFKQHSFSLPNDSVKLRIFDNNIYGLIDFENPYIHVWSYNSCGMPIRVNMNNFRATSTANAPYLVVLTGYPNPWDINAPNLSQIGQIMTTNYTLDKTNSNVKNAINLSPQYFVVDLQGTSNPAGGVSSNFLIDTNRFSIDVQVELPLYGKAWDFRLADTLDFNFGQDAKMDMLEWMSIRVNTENGFPVDGKLQIYFLDDNNVIIDSLFLVESDQQVINAAPVGAGPDYRVTQSSSKMTEVRLEQPRLTGLEPTAKIVVLGRMATIQNGTELVKIYSDYLLDVRLGARAKFNVNF
jgi:hypothetical protein